MPNPWKATLRNLIFPLLGLRTQPDLHLRQGEALWYHASHWQQAPYRANFRLLSSARLRRSLSPPLVPCLTPPSLYPYPYPSPPASPSTRHAFRHAWPFHPSLDPFVPSAIPLVCVVFFFC